MAELNTTSRSKSSQLISFLKRNSVTILFVFLCLAGVVLSGQPLFFIANELVTRLTRNSFLVLALIIPVLAGMGLNFSITIGAMAGQMGIILVAHWGIGGWQGVLLAMLLAAPVAIISGRLTGTLLNKTRGQEMIASMIAGFFANGIYQFIFLFLIGSLIPFKDKVMVLNGGVGLRNTVDLTQTIKYGLDEVIRFPFFWALLIGSGLFLLYFIRKVIKSEEIHETKMEKHKDVIGIILSAFLMLFSINILFNPSLPRELAMMKNLKLSVLTIFIVGLLAVFNVIITRTKLGQDFRTVGQNKHIAKVSGINVSKVRILAITLSTLFASWGQIIFLQNLGVLNTYGSHVQIGLFSIAALLVGGASVSKATVGQAFLGVLLFHTLFIVSPWAGKNLFGDAQIGEFFRAFVAYGVIGVSLGLHAWRKFLLKKDRMEGSL